MPSSWISSRRINILRTSCQPQTSRRDRLCNSMFGVSLFALAVFFACTPRPYDTRYVPPALQLEKMRQDLESQLSAPKTSSLSGSTGLGRAARVRGTPVCAFRRLSRKDYCAGGSASPSVRQLLAPGVQVRHASAAESACVCVCLFVARLFAVLREVHGADRREQAH